MSKLWKKRINRVWEQPTKNNQPRLASNAKAQQAMKLRPGRKCVGLHETKNAADDSSGFSDTRMSAKWVMMSVARVSGKKMTLRDREERDFPLELSRHRSLSLGWTGNVRYPIVFRQGQNGSGTGSEAFSSSGPTAPLRRVAQEIFETR